MTSLDTTDGLGDEPSRLLRFVFIIGIFVLAGPPVGGVVFWAGLAVTSLLRAGRLPSEPLGLLFVCTLYAYPLGAPFALASGILHASAAIWLRWSTIVVPLAVTLIVNVVGMAMYVWLKPQFGSMISEFAIGLAFSIPTSLIASIVCWRLTRGLLRPA